MTKHVHGRYATAQFTLVMREQRTRIVHRSARDVALHILGARFGGSDAALPGAAGLFDFQRDAVARASVILARLGGVLIADSVGLGKTFIARALIGDVVARGGRIAVVGPAGLERHWRRSLADVAAFEWISYARLSRSRIEPESRDLLVFDEAHALRNPSTRRYRHAARMCAGAPVMLLTATPVNNSIWDLYHLLRLFAGDRSFSREGVPSMRAAFEEAEAACLLGDAPSVRPILRAAMIRRTREVLRDRTDAASSDPAFPQHGPIAPVYYPFGLDAPEDALERIGSDLLALTFPAHDSGSHEHRAPAAELMRRSLLKRLESSTHAFLRSIAAYDALLDRCESALRRGFIVRARDDGTARDDGEQLRLDELLFERVDCVADRGRYAAALARERALTASLRATCGTGADGKLAVLVAMLDGELRGRKVIVFTQFRDTGRHIHNFLRRRFRTALVDGAAALLGDSSCDRASVVQRFAPGANGVGSVSERERIDVLVATDILSEGFNLQDASVVISYDLPWNPIRLTQRLGRVDRLGSPHARVDGYAFLPGDLERYLGIVERIARKTAAIEATVGSDMPLLHAGLARAIGSRSSRGCTVALRGENDPLEIDERLRALVRDEGLPLGPERHLWVGSVDAAHSGAQTSPPALVAARVGARFEWVAVVAGRAVADDALCARLLDRAVRENADSAGRDSVPVASVEATLAVARTELARRVARASTGALLPAGGRAAAIGRRLLRLVAAVPGGPDAALCRRVERALERLAAAPDSALESRASMAAARPAPETASVDDLLASIEALPARAQPAAEPLTDMRVDIIAVLFGSVPDR